MFEEGKPLYLAVLESSEEEIIELRQNGKNRKFCVITRQWNDEKVGFDLLLVNVIGKNWRSAERHYKAFQTPQGKTTFIKENE